MKNIFAKAILEPRWFLTKTYNKVFVEWPFFMKRKKSFKRFLKTFPYDLVDYKKITNELFRNKNLWYFTNKRFFNYKLQNKLPQHYYSWPTFLYYYIRKTKPKVIIETGCWYGVSTVHILAALEKNNLGKLYTIDKPAYPSAGGYYDENPYVNETERRVFLPDGAEPGFIVPENYHKNWLLIKGESTSELPVLLKKLGKCDMFLHDSLHSYENMFFEFSTILPFLEKNGCIFSDNIDWNDAFKDFAKKNNKEFSTYLAYYEGKELKHNFGMIKK